MDISPPPSLHQPRIERYGNGGFFIKGAHISGNILIHQADIITLNETDAANLTTESFAPFLSGTKPEILLLGTGAAFKPLSSSLKAALRAQGLTVDAMDTGAACRTFNVLLAEDRRVAAALFAI